MPAPAHGTRRAGIVWRDPLVIKEEAHSSSPFAFYIFRPAASRTPYPALRAARRHWSLGTAHRFDICSIPTGVC